jgi:hypothetical protein
MLKLKMLINVSLVLTILFYLSPINYLIAGDCDSKGAGAGTPTVTGNYIYPPGHECTEDPDLEYDTVNSHETIDRNGSATLIVIGNNPPYTWSVSGNGFSLQESQTTGLTNTLIADDTACGAATITITGCSGPPVTGYVRCTTGVWTAWSNICGTYSTGFYSNVTCTKDEVYRQFIAYCRYQASCNCPNDEGCTPEWLPHLWPYCCDGVSNRGIFHTRERFWECP